MASRQRSLKLSEWDELGDADAPTLRGRIDGPEEIFASQCRSLRLPRFEQQLRFALSIFSDKGKPRQWRFDFAFPEYHLAIEIQGVVVRRIGGQIVTMGGHADVQGMRNDHAKHNAAILLGWSVLQFMPPDIKSKLAIETTMRVLAARGWKP